MEGRHIDIIRDAEGNQIVLINDILFKGKRTINWDEVKGYLKRFVGEEYTIKETQNGVFIGTDFTDEYTSSVYTWSLKGALSKAKANASQGIPEMFEISTNKVHTENRKEKHAMDAEGGWYRFESRFALPVYEANGEIERYNVYHVYLIIRHDRNGKKYLYDIINIKKRNEQPA